MLFVESVEFSGAGRGLCFRFGYRITADIPTQLFREYPVHLWMEKEIKSVANVSRRDLRGVLALAAEMQIKPEIQEFPLEKANQALVELKIRKIRGAKVLRID